MTSLVITYAVAWVGIGAFAVWMIIKHRRLIRRFEDLRLYIDAEPQKVTRLKRTA